MKINVRQRDGVTILEPRGKITIGVGDVALREAVHREINAGNTSILIDMSGVTTIDSSGIGELVSTFTSTKNRGGSLKLLHLPDKVTDILQITQLITIFDIYEEEDEAVRSFPSQSS